jgi:hypothetical protein
MAQDDNPHPVTAASVRKRMLRTSEEYWDRLQYGYRRAVAAEYPNPGRKDCPGTDALQDLAERNVRRQDLRTDRRWKHAMQCGPCYEEYIVLRYGVGVSKTRPLAPNARDEKARSDLHA